MNYSLKETGLRIQQHRNQSGYTQEELAKILNIDRSNLSRIESGRRSCSVDLLVQLADLFDVTLDYLILGREHTSANAVYLKANIETLIGLLEAFKLSL